MRGHRLCALLVGSLLAAAAPGPAAAQTKLSFPTWQLEEPGFGEWWKEVTAAFEAAHPGLDIEMQQVAFKDYVNQLTIRFASNRPPDILVLPSTAFGGFAAQGWLEPLDARIQGTAIADRWSSLQAQMVWRGETLGVLLMGYGFMLFANEARLEEAGAAPPESFPAFAEAAGKVTRRDAGVFGLAAVTTEHPTVVLDFIRFIRWQGQGLIKDGRYNLTAPEVVGAIEAYRRVVGGNAPLGSNSTVARQLFLDGKTGFLLDGPWVWARLGSAPEAVRPRLTMAPAPFAPPLGGAANSIHVPAGLDPARKEEAWKFIAFLARPEWQRRYFILSASPPGYVDALTDEDKAQHPHLAAIADAARGAESIVPVLEPVQANVNEFSAIIERAALRVLSTRDPVAGILADTQAELERAVPLD